MRANLGVPRSRRLEVVRPTMTFLSVMFSTARKMFQLSLNWWEMRRSQVSAEFKVRVLPSSSKASLT